MLIGPYVAYYYAPKAEISLSDAGPRRQETNTAKSAYGYQVVNYREQKLREGEIAAESLLQFLEDNKTAYPDWVASTAFKKYRSLFIKNAKEFNELFQSASPYRNYWAWRYKMYDVEQQIIKKEIGKELFDYLKDIDEDAAGTYSEAETELLYKLKKAIAYFTVAYAIPFHNVRLDSNGITVVSGNNTVANKDQDGRRAASGDDLSHIARDADGDARGWMQDALDYIIANAVEFPLYPVVVASYITADEYCDGSNECLGSSYGLI